jgi:hypothetical protein
MHICPHELSLIFQFFNFFEILYYYILTSYQYFFISIAAFIRKLFDVVTKVSCDHQFGKKYYG